MGNVLTNTDRPDQTHRSDIQEDKTHREKDRKLGLVTPIGVSNFDRSKLSLLSCIDKSGESLAHIYVCNY